MNIVFFCHSLLSDWNHGNAHFLRGLVSELAARGHHVRAFEPRDAWSALSLVDTLGALPLDELSRVYPLLDVTRYDPARPELEQATDGADLVLVHEWNEPRIVKELGRLWRASARFTLLFHDTHHRMVSATSDFAGIELDGYDGVLAFGEALRERYVARGWGKRAFTFHEAADVRVFRPLPRPLPTKDVIWVGNYGDGERSRELQEYLFSPVKALGATGTVYGVRYPPEGERAVRAAGLDFGGFLANYDVPAAFAEHDVTVHVPRRPYAESLPGIPTIRVFEALACGIPLVSAPWSDCEGLFRADDFLRVSSGAEMRRALGMLLHEPATRREFAQRGLETILARHTCSHRANELLAIAEQFRVELKSRAPRQPERVTTWD